MKEIRSEAVDTDIEIKYKKNCSWKITNLTNKDDNEKKKEKEKYCVSTSGVKSYVLFSSSQDKSCRCACINFPWVKYATETDSNPVSDTLSVFVLNPVTNIFFFNIKTFG